jgi:hypothetical protein
VATYRCGRCGHVFAARTQAEYVADFSAHIREHERDAAAALSALQLRTFAEILSGEVRRNGRVTVRQIISHLRTMADTLEKGPTTSD